MMGRSQDFFFDDFFPDFFVDLRLEDLRDVELLPVDFPDDFELRLVELLAAFLVVLLADLVVFLLALLVVFFAAFFPDFFADFLLGTFLPSARASDRPIAIACLRLLTFLPEPPLFSVPAFRFFITRSTSADAAFEYFRAIRFSLVIPSPNSSG